MSDRCFGYLEDLAKLPFHPAFEGDCDDPKKKFFCAKTSRL